MKIKFGNVHKLRYKVLSTFLSLAVLFTGTGLWCNYVLNNDLNAEAAGKANSLTDEGNTLLIDTTLYDYFYDAGNGGTYAVGQGGAQGGSGSSEYIGGYYDPYTNFNTAISNWWATSGSGSKLETPLYFGNFWEKAPSYNGFNVLANNSVRTSDYVEDKSLAQKVTPGLLESDVSTSDMDSLPYFNPTFLSNGSTGPVTSATATATINSIYVYWDSTNKVSYDVFYNGNNTFKWGQSIKIYNTDTDISITDNSGSANPSASTTTIYYEKQKWDEQPNRIVVNYSVNGSSHSFTISGSSLSRKQVNGRNAWYTTYSLGSSEKSYFNETKLSGAYGDSYPGLTFPFRKTISSGDTYWEFSGSQMPTNLNKATNQLKYKYTSSVTGGIYGDSSLQSTSDYSPDRSPQRRAAFFPFDSGNEELKDVDYGFGAKFNINFNLTDDGKTINGNDIIFEFKGDDDVWVFIDDKLVLDMGGDHGEAHGIINFAKQTSKVETGEKNDFGSNTTAQTNLKNVLKNSKSNRHTMTIYYMERGMFESNLYMKFNFIPNSNVMSVSEQTDFTGVNAGLQDKTQEVANKDVFTYTLSNKTNILNPQIPGNGLKYPSNNYVRRNLTGGYLGLQGNPSGGTGNTYNFSAGGVISSFVDVSNTAYLLNDDYAQATTGGTAPYWGNENPDGSTRVVGKTDADGRVNLLYGQRAEFDGQFIAGSQMKVVPEDNLYTYTGWDVDGTNSYTNGFTFDPQTRSRSDYYNTNVTVTVKDGEDERNIFTGSLENYKTNTIFNSGYDFGAAFSLKTIEAEQLFENTVKTGSIKVTKALKNNTETPKSQNGAGNAQFTIKVELTDLFGVAGENVTDYSSIEVTGNHGKTLSDDGTYTLEKGESFTINGIPVGTKVTISELDSASGKYFDAAKAEITPNGLTEVEGTQTGEYTVTNVRNTGTITINKQFAADSTETTGEFTARVTFDTADNPESISLNNYNISYTDSKYTASTKAVLQSGSGSSYFEVTISDKTPAEIKNVPYGIKYKVEEVLTGDQTNAGWQTPTMTVGSANYDGSSQTFEGDAIYTITNNKQETVDIYVQKAFADLNGKDKTKTITEREEIAANRTVTFKVYIPQNSAPDFVTYTYYTKGGVANTKTVKKETDDYYFNWDPGKYNRRYCITVSDPDISLSTNSTKILTLPKIEDLAVVVAEDTTDNKWVPTYYDVTGTEATQSDNVTFDDTKNQYKFKIVNKPVTDTYTLKVKKVIENGQTDDNHKPFKVDLKLKFSAANNNDVVQLMEGYDFKPEIWFENHPSNQPGTYNKLTYNKDVQIDNVKWTYDNSDKTMTCTLEILNVQEKEGNRLTGSRTYYNSEYRVYIPKVFAGYECNAELVSAYEDLDGSVQINKNEWLDPTYKYKDESSSNGTFTNGKISDTGDNILTITNNRLNVEAYLTITKYIDSLHYGENDNAHGFADNIGIPNIDSKKPEYSPLYDPFHYLQYTQAEQLFEFKITEYDLSGKQQHEYHVFLKFGPDSARLPNAVTYNGNDYYYNQSKMFKVKPGYSYTVEEVGANATQNTGISWRYKYDGNQVSTGKGVNYADGKCKYIGDRQTKELVSTFSFYNSRTKGSQTIESDQSSIINHIDYTRN